MLTLEGYIKHGAILLWKAKMDIGFGLKSSFHFSASRIWIYMHCKPSDRRCIKNVNIRISKMVLFTPFDCEVMETCNFFLLFLTILSIFDLESLINLRGLILSPVLIIFENFLLSSRKLKKDNRKTRLDTMGS